MIDVIRVTLVASPTVSGRTLLTGLQPPRFDIGSEYLQLRRSTESPGRRRPRARETLGAWRLVGSEARWVVCRPQRRLIVFWTTMKIVDS